MPIDKSRCKKWDGLNDGWPACLAVSLDLPSVVAPAVVSREPESLLHQLASVLGCVVSRVQSLLVAGAQRVEQPGVF